VSSSLVSPTDPSTRDLGASAEIALDQPIITTAPGSHPTIGFDGTGYFVVWDDFRTQRPVLYGAGVTADGTVLEPLGIPLLDSRSSGAYRPVIAFDGAAYLVVVRVGNALHGLRVSPDGQVLDGGVFPISSARQHTFGQKVIFDGTNHVVTWVHEINDDPAGSGVYMARVRPDGTVLDPGGIHVAAEYTRQVDLAFDGENYLLAWVRTFADQPAQVVGARVTPAGVVLDPGGFLITQHPEGVSNHQAIPAVAFDGTSYVVAWSSFSEETYRDTLRVTRVTPAGAVPEPAGIRISEFYAEFSSFSRIVAVPSSAGIIVAWSREGSDDGGSFWQDVELALVPVTGDAIVLPENSLGRGVDVALATGSGGALMAWTAGENDPSEQFTPIAAARLNADGTTVDSGSFPVSRHANPQEVRAVASDGQSYFVVWTDARNPANEGRSLYGARVSADGTALDAEGILITPQDVDVVDVVFDGENYLVMFVRQYEGSDNPLRGVRVSPQGQVLDTPSIELPLCSQSPSSHTPRAAAAGDRMLLIANGCDFETLALAAVVIDRQGTPLSTPAAIVHVDDRRKVSAPEVASDGTGYLVVWHDQSHTVYGRRVDAAGIPIGDAFPITSVPDKYITRAAVRFGNGHYHVVWQRADGIFGARVDTAGQVLDPDGFPIIPGQAYQELFFAGAVAFRGENLVVAYQQATEPGNHYTWDNHATEVGPTGAVLSQFPISTTPESEGAPVLAANDAQQVLAAYTRYVAEAPLSARRARARLLVESAEPGPDAGPGTPDAGPGTPDAGPGTPDAGDPPGNPGDGDGGGCGCAATASPGDAGALVLLALGLLLALRRRHDLSA
jgi:MYXO-CTERM domain-containing protein